MRTAKGKHHMPLLVIIFLWASFAHVVAAKAACGPDTAPSQAAAWGYTCEVFFDNFTTSGTSNIDINDTLNPRFKWFVHNKWPGLFAGFPDWANSDTTPVGDITVDPGGHGIKITPSLNNTTTHFQMMSCATNNGMSYQWIGTALTGGFYFEVGFYSISPPGQQAGQLHWASAWMLPTKEDMANPAYIRHSEIDLFEANSNTRFVHSLDPVTGDTPRRYGGFISQTTPHSYGVLIVPAAANGGTGFLRGFVDGAVDPFNTDATWTPSDKLFSFIETDHHCFLMTSGYRQSMILQYVRVFAQPPPGSGRRDRGP